MSVPSQTALPGRLTIASKRAAAMPRDISVTNSQGGISSVIMQTMQNSLHAAKVDRGFTSIICEVEADPDDPAFDSSDEPRGYYFSAAEARELRKEFNWNRKEDANRDWRMVVPTPRPRGTCSSTVIRFIEGGGKRAIIARLDNANEPLLGQTGTQVAR